MAHKATIRQLKAAEQALTDGDSNNEPNTSAGAESNSAAQGKPKIISEQNHDETTSSQEDSTNASQALLIVKNEFQAEVATVQSDSDSSTMLATEQAEMSWDKVLLQSYDILSKTPPASKSLTILLSWLQEDDDAAGSAGPRLGDATATSVAPSDASDQEADVSALLQELTTTTAAGLNLYQSRSKKEDERMKGVPEWIYET